jgi:hypothetical protein
VPINSHSSTMTATTMLAVLFRRFLIS